MPCHTDPPSQEEIYKWDAPGAACEALKILELRGFIGDISPRTLRWWAMHKQMDAAREAREAKAKAQDEAQKRALSKLTAEEAEALGLKPKW
jgi:hypothetical protein